MNYTKEQTLAITLQDKDIMVSAGAGAGKTRVLVSRILGQIMSQDDPQDLDRFLVMTFTEAAAAEMKERIRNDLDEKLQMDPSSLRIRRQIRLVPQAQISTIHSYCSQLIRTHYHEIGIDPSYRIAEEGEVELLRKKAVEELLENAYEEARPEFLRFVDAFAPGNHDRPIEEMILQLYTFSRCFPDAKSWFAKVKEKMRKMADPKEDAIDEVFLEIIKEPKAQIVRCLKQTDHCLSLLVDGEPEKYANYLDNLRMWLTDVVNADTPDTFRNAVLGANRPSLPRANRADKEWEGYESVRILSANVKKITEKYQSFPYTMSKKELLKESSILLPLLEEYFRLVLEFEERYSAGKRQENVFDFDDLEHFALKLLVDHYDEDGNPYPSDTAREQADRFRQIYVDEYQDINLIQETILRMIHDNSKNQIFTVGDVKQSIYRFRQARPDLFLERYDNYEPYESMKDESGEIRIELLQNFRSSHNVISVINALFSKMMTRDFGGVDYDKKTELKPGLPNNGKEVPSEFLLFVKDDDGTEYPVDPILEAAMIADQIERLIQEGYQFKDMVILLRSLPNWKDEIETYLQSRGIPVLSDSKKGFFHTREVQIILDYLAIVDNVYQDIPMAACMLSSIGRFTEEELARLRVFGKDYEESFLFSQMNDYLECGTDEGLKQKISRFLELLLYFRKEKKEVPLSALLWDIYIKTGYYYNVTQLSHGAERKERLLILLKKAEEYEETVFKGLFYFNRYMEQLKSYDIELGAGGASEENAVYIMSIHKSKGLEFPVVFVSGTGKQFNKMDLNKSVLTHPEIGVGIDYIDVENRFRHPSLIEKYIQTVTEKEMLEEELRILYVAMTRAEQKLIITGVVKEKTLQELADREFDKGDRLGAACFLDWILPGLADHPSVQQFLLARRDQNITPAQKDSYLETRLFHWKDVENAITAVPVSAQKNSSDLESILEKYVKNLDETPVTSSFSREYPYLEATKAKRKYSVSELKKLSQIELEGEESHYEKRADTKENEELIPVFLREQEEKITSARKGTIIHSLMEHLPFERIDTPDRLSEEINILRENMPETQEIDLAWFEQGAKDFLFSDIGDEIRKMDLKGCLKKELPFTIGVTEGPDAVEGETVLVQGIIDLAVRSPEGWWLIDYKTDRVSEGEESILVDRYQKQMVYYKTALEQITGVPVVESWIYSFALRRFISV